MFLPVTVDPRQVPFFEAERVLKCFCGKEVCMKDVHLVWTHAVGSHEYGYYAACSPMCIFIHVSQGSA